MTGAAASDQRAINDARALIDWLVANDWQEIHLLVGDTEIFIAQAAGRPNPLRAEDASVAIEIGGSTEMIVAAPHVGTIVDLPAVGAAVTKGEPLAIIRVLDTVENIVAPTSGAVTALHVDIGALVEFGEPMVSLLPAAAQ